MTPLVSVKISSFILKMFQWIKYSLIIIEGQSLIKEYLVDGNIKFTHKTVWGSVKKSYMWWDARLLCSKKKYLGEPGLMASITSVMWSNDTNISSFISKTVP